MKLPAFDHVGLAAHWVRTHVGTPSGPRTHVTPTTGAGGGRPLLRLVTGGSRRARHEAIASLLDQRAAESDDETVVVEANPSWWPFHPDPLAGVRAGTLVVVLDAARAFPRMQVDGTRLVLTQSLFSLPVWLDHLHMVGASGLLMEADGAELRGAAQEALDGRGGWADFEIVSLGTARNEAVVEAGDTRPPQSAAEAQGPDDEIALRLALAFARPAPLARLELCQTLVDQYRGSAIAHLALASACMEHAALDAASSNLAAAAALCPAWGAVDHERGKLHLRTERLDLAVEAFASAARRLPRFSPAFVNLGAALGELGRPIDALAAFHDALAIDPLNVQVLNNVGVTQRDLGRLDEAERAFLRVIEMNPGFVFGHYNLGHTRFLQGRFAEAVAAYEGGQLRDPQQNAVQAARLGYARLGAGDSARGLLEVEAALRTISDERRDSLVEEGLEIEAGLRTLEPVPDGLDALHVVLTRPPAGRT